MSDAFPTTVKMDPAKVAELLRGSDGLVYRHWIKLGDYVKNYAKAQVGVKTGKLRDSIVKRIDVEGNSLRVRIGTDVPYALYHHEGTIPHRIVGNPFLAFEIGGKAIVVRSVNHPGTSPNRFLSRALDAVRELL